MRNVNFIGSPDTSFARYSCGSDRCWVCAPFGFNVTQIFSAAMRGEAKTVSDHNIQHGEVGARDDESEQQMQHLAGEDSTVYEL